MQAHAPGWQYTLHAAWWWQGTHLARLLSLLAAHAQQTAQQEEVDLQLAVHIWQCANLAKDLVVEGWVW